MKLCAAALLTALLLTACAPVQGSGTLQAPSSATTSAIVANEPTVMDDPPLTLYTNMDGVRLLAAPALSPSCLELLQGAKPVVRFYTKGKFSKIMDPDSGRIGWVESRFLNHEAAPETTPDTPSKGATSETF